VTWLFETYPEKKNKFQSRTEFVINLRCCGGDLDRFCFSQIKRGRPLLHVVWILHRDQSDKQKKKEQNYNSKSKKKERKWDYRKNSSNNKEIRFKAADIWEYYSIYLFSISIQIYIYTPVLVLLTIIIIIVFYYYTMRIQKLLTNTNTRCWLAAGKRSWQVHREKRKETHLDGWNMK
jgi:hypothetical protein